jgi:glycosyltransferase involved in cell wall biosynthesis
MLSFVVPAHNEQARLGRTVQAIHAAARATGRPYEVIVVDDASTDATAEVARKHDATAVSVNRRQIAATRNVGGRAARGERLLFVDADTVVSPRVVADALRQLDRGAAGGGAPARFEGPVPRWWWATSYSSAAVATCTASLRRIERFLLMPGTSSPRPRKRFPKSVLASISESKIIGVRAGRDHRFTGVWVVVVRGPVFARPWDDRAGGWRDAFVDEPRGAVQVGTRQVPVRARKVRGDRLLDAIDDAYAQKYNTEASQKWVRGFRLKRRRLTTTEFVPP